MRLIALLLVLVAIAGIYNYGGDSLDEQQVRDFYDAHEKAFTAQDGETLCKMAAPDFEMVILYRMDSHQQRKVTTRDEYCRSNGEWSRKLAEVSRRVGGELPFDYSQTVDKVEIAADEKSAAVEMRATLQVPGIRMTFRTHDRVVRKRWKTLIEHSEGTAWVGPAYR